MLYFDSGHYLGSARQLALFLKDCSQAAPGSTSARELFDCLMLDGPVLPTLTACVFALLHRLPSESDWRICAVILSCLNGVSALLISLLGKQLTGSRKWGLVAGLAWAVYPGAVAASGRFLLEPLSCVLLLAATWFSALTLAPEQPADSARTRSLACYLSALLAGACQALIFLTRAILMPVWLLLDAAVLILSKGNSRRAAITLWLAIGIATVLAPWLWFSSRLSGHAALMPERAAAVNIAIGFNFETDGFDGKPDPPLQRLHADSDSPLCTAVAIWKQEPAKLANLFCRKVVRLWSSPWNDFRYPVMGLPFEIQRYFHTLLLLACLLGAMAFFQGAAPRPADDRRGRFIACACVATIAGHLVYVLFQANSRYGYTALPFAVILAAYLAYALCARKPARSRMALLCLSSTLTVLSLHIDMLPAMVQIAGTVQAAVWLDALVKLILICWTAQTGFDALKQPDCDPGTGDAAMLAVTAMLFAAALILGAQALDSVSLREWSCSLKPGQSANRLIHLSPPLTNYARQNIDWALVLVDGDASMENTRISVNGHRLASPPESLYRYRPDRYEIVGLMQLFTPILGKSLQEMRQWRAVPVPLDFLNLDGDNLLSLAPAADTRVTIYGDYLPTDGQRRRLPALGTYSLTRLFSCPDGFDGRPVDPIGLPAAGSLSWLADGNTRRTDDISPQFGKQTGEYRLHLILGINKSSPSLIKQASAQAEQKATWSKTFAAGDFAPPMQDAGDNQLHVSKAVLRPYPLTSCRLDIPPALTGKSHLSVRLAGIASSPGRESSAGIVIMAEDRALTTRLQLAATPLLIKATAGAGKPFAVADCLPCAAIPAGPQRLLIDVYPLKGETVFQNFHLQLAEDNQPSFAGHFAAVY